MSAPLENLYNKEFYDEQVAGSISSAKKVLGRLFEIYRPRSVVDFGCGMGGWLREAELLGSQVIKGFDGDWVKRGSLLSKNIDFTPENMMQDIDLEDRYDLCISLEVAEHLPDKHAKKYVDMLCNASDLVLFGAAIEGQGGVNHINERWQSYWVDLFKQNGYREYDIFRGALWDDDDVRWWYKQNAFLFVKTSAEKVVVDAEVLIKMEHKIIDVVHPDNYQTKIKQLKEAREKTLHYREKYQNELSKIQYPKSLRFCLGILKRYIVSRIH